MLAVDCNETNILFHALSPHVDITHVLIENKISKRLLIKNRIKKLGWWKVGGQLLFQVLTQKLLFHFSANRRNEIMTHYCLNASPLPAEKIIQVSSVNDEQTREKIRELNPDLILVNGTRIISKKTLAGTNAKFVNMHMGITPKYRGVHGAYWALVKDDKDLCGVTVHYIDAGIDTGSVLKQTLIKPDQQKDNFTTYPYLQLGEGIPVLQDVLTAIAAGQSDEALPLTTESALWYHPTFYQYWRNRIINKVK